MISLIYAKNTTIEYYPTVLLFKKGEVEKRLDATPGVGLTKKQLKELQLTHKSLLNFCAKLMDFLFLLTTLSVHSVFAVYDVAD